MTMMKAGAALFALMILAGCSRFNVTRIADKLQNGARNYSAAQEANNPPPIYDGQESGQAAAPAPDANGEAEPGAAAAAAPGAATAAPPPPTNPGVIYYYQPPAPAAAPQ